MSTSIQARAHARPGRAAARRFIHQATAVAGAALAVCAAPALAQSSYLVYVQAGAPAGTSPPAFATLQAALANVASAANAAPATTMAARIEVFPGTYVLSDTVVVDMPTNVTLEIAAHDSTNMPQFSGAQTTISGGWRQDANGYAEYTFATAPALFRSLYVSDGVVRRRSRYPDYPLAAPIQGAIGSNDILVSQNDLQSAWLQAGDAEIVAMIGYRAPRFAALASRISGAANNNYDVTAPFGMLPSTTSDGLGDYRFYVENIPQLAAGQWRYDAANRKLVYHPIPNQEGLSGCTPTGGCQIVNTATSTPLTFTVPNPVFDHKPLLQVGVGPVYTMPTTAKLSGDFGNARFAKAVKLTSLGFEHTDWSFTSDNNDPVAGSTTIGQPADYAGGQALSSPIPAVPQTDTSHVVQPATLAPAVELFCNTCTVQASTFADTGGHGLRVNGPGNLVLSNQFARIGGNGIVVGNRWQRDTDKVVTANTVIKGNVLQHVGVRHPEGTAIISYDSSGNLITSNTIDDVAYSGISAGFAQSGEYILTGTAISENRISNVLEQTDDGGAIYVAGQQNQSSITHNFIQGVPAHRWQLRWVGYYGLYFDKDSNGFSVTDNFVGPSTNGQVKLSRASNITLSDNYFVAGLVDWIATAPPAGSYLNTTQPLKAYQPGPVYEVGEISGSSTDGVGHGDQSLNNLFARYYAAFPSTKRYILDDASASTRAISASDYNFYFDANIAQTFDASCLLGTTTSPCTGESATWTDTKSVPLDAHSQRQLCLPANSGPCTPDDPLLTTNRRTPVAGDPSSYLPQASDVALASNSMALTGHYVTTLQFASTGAAAPLLSPSVSKAPAKTPPAKPARATAQVAR